MRRVVFSAEARENIKSIGRYTSQQWGDRQAEKYLAELKTQIELVQRMPTIGVDRSQEFNGPVFSLFVGSHAIYYVFNDERLTIVAILHQSMLPRLHLRGNR